MVDKAVSIYTIKPVSFQEGERDPFGFDDYAEKLGADYLPFSGTIAKPIYFLFVAYVDQFLRANKHLWKNERQKRDCQVRLEKLLVYCWKKSAVAEGDSLRGAYILGNSFDLETIDVFTPRGWIIQNAFRIYSDKKFSLQTLEYYQKRIGEKQYQILERFLTVDIRTPDFNRKDFLNKLIKDLQSNGYSLFKGHYLYPDLKKRFKKELEQKIEKKHKVAHFKIIQKFFHYKTFSDDNFWTQIFEKQNNGLPFLSLNSWFGAFVKAVDADLYQKPLRKSLWAEADKAYHKIPANLRLGVLQYHRPKSKWFYFDKNVNQYVFPKEYSASEIRRIQLLWEAYTKRQSESTDSVYFFNYRHWALLRMLKELF